MIVELLHGRRRLSFERLSQRPGSPLLLLHVLFGSRRGWDPSALGWPGPIWALDLGGHGESEWVGSSAYSPELFAADADTALAHLDEPSFLAGSGSGGYVGLLLAGARPDEILGLAILPGAGLSGGGERPPDTAPFPPLAKRGDPARDAFDPRVASVDADLRPAPYARSFARRARKVVLCELETAPQGWWAAARDEISTAPARNAHEALAQLRA
jgi:pimeloyl-ACP methyl ester carboxylesterase